MRKYRALPENRERKRKYQRKYHAENRERKRKYHALPENRERKRKYHAMNRSSLADSYIIKRIRARTIISTKEIKENPELIEQKRIMLKLKRIIIKIKKTKNETSKR